MSQSTNFECDFDDSKARESSRENKTLLIKTNTS